MYGNELHVLLWPEPSAQRPAPFRLALTLRTKIRRPLSLHELLDRRRARQAWFAGTLVDIEFLAEVARHAVRVDVVAQRRAARTNRILQDRFDGFDERFNLLASQTTCGAAWTDASAKECLARIDVADADDHLTIHDRLFDRDAPAFQRPRKIRGVELIRERFRRERREERMLERILARPKQAAEAARVVEAQAHGVVEHEVDVIVSERRGVARHEPQTAGHAEVQDERAAF